MFKKFYYNLLVQYFLLEIFSRSFYYHTTNQFHYFAPYYKVIPQIAPPWIWWWFMQTAYVSWAQQIFLNLNSWHSTFYQPNRCRDLVALMSSLGQINLNLYTISQPNNGLTPLAYWSRVSVAVHWNLNCLCCVFLAFQLQRPGSDNNKLLNESGVNYFKIRRLISECNNKNIFLFNYNKLFRY